MKGSSEPLGVAEGVDHLEPSRPAGWSKGRESRHRDDGHPADQNQRGVLQQREPEGGGGRVARRSPAETAVVDRQGLGDRNREAEGRAGGSEEQPLQQELESDSALPNAQGARG